MSRIVILIHVSFKVESRRKLIFCAFFQVWLGWILNQTLAFPAEKCVCVAGVLIDCESVSFCVLVMLTFATMLFCFLCLGTLYVFFVFHPQYLMFFVAKNFHLLARHDAQLYSVQVLRAAQLCRATKPETEATDSEISSFPRDGVGVHITGLCSKMNF